MLRRETREEYDGFLCALAIFDAAWPIFITACWICGIA
jgi:hypothetical protein